MVQYGNKQRDRASRVGERGMMVFSFLDCEFRINFSCFALLAFCCLFAGIGSGAFFLLAVFLHEAAHISALCLFRAHIRTVTLSALGCRVILDSESRLSYAKSGIVSLAGPLINLISFGVAVAFGKGTHPFAYASLALGMLHILPIEPLDGGLALRSFLSIRLDPRTAARVSFGVSLALLFPLAVLGFTVLLYTKNNYSLLALSIYIMLYLVLKRDFSAP